MFQQNKKTLYKDYKGTFYQKKEGGFVGTMVESVGTCWNTLDLLEQRWNRILYKKVLLQSGNAGFRFCWNSWNSWNVFRVLEKKELKIAIKRVKSIRELQEDTSQGWKRRMGQLYFHQLEDGNMVPRVISERTNGKWVQQMISKGLLWIAEEDCVCENN